MVQLELDNGCRVVLEAIDPLTGSPVNGVVLTAVAIYGDAKPGDSSYGDLSDPVPGYTPDEVVEA